ncbi:bifunctional DNA primase/polymerase [endosymbiont GvMRE of Glomus versiforme]|uniref:bifunctional DNA primase/polymerase n=1 Tax=endosymbiont GvMRE of Glomus versiforme TaxID=2039283 RepID=UPI000ECFF229|nr:bifunctional DNA primase/polymerase [endosymbiont GvMRE of Glomus versiforme]RHZ35645.1 hypothetical protein GvMRE_IIg33 [endosymbiont GvMRE of Glomus versiforme]
MNQLSTTEKKLIKVFDRPSIRIRIPRLEINQGKFPLIPNWPNVYEPLLVSQILEQGYNWGIRTGKKIGDYFFIVIDLDDIWARERIQASRYVQTAKGIHVYCLVRELPNNSILTNKESKRIGELHGLGKQVVGIGSLHKSGVRYSLQLKGKNNAPWFLKFETVKELELFLAERNIFIKLGKNKN